MSKPSLKLVLSLLNQKNSLTIDWFLYYLSSKEFLNSLSVFPWEIIQLEEVFHEATKIFIKDIKNICESASPDKNPKPLLQYLRQGRGLLLLTGLRNVIDRSAVFNDELCAVLLSLQSFLIKLDESYHGVGHKCDLLDNVPTPSCPRVSTSFVRKKTPTSNRTRRRKRNGFPDVRNARTSDKVGENLSQWEEDSRSSDQEDSLTTDSSHGGIKYIPIDYFDYFENANIDSDEFMKQSSKRLTQPPPLPVFPACCVQQIMENCLHIVCCMIPQAGGKHVDSVMLQLGVVTSNQLKGEPGERMSVELQCQCVAILSHCVLSIRYRPDLVGTPQVRSILQSVLPVFSEPTTLLQEVWTDSVLCFLVVWRDFTLHSSDMSQVSGIIPLVSSVVQGLQHYPVIEVVSCVVRILRVVSDSELAVSCAQLIFDIATSSQATEQFQKAALEELTELFRYYCYPVDQFNKISSKTELLIKSPNFETFLSLVEHVIENLMDSEPRWCTLLGDRDSDLATTDELSWEENNNRYTESEDNSAPSEFEFYLRMLEIIKEEETLSQLISHLEKVTNSADGESRHRISLQVILPYITNNLAKCLPKSQDCDSYHLMESMLLIMSELVRQQPTAMALIRNQEVWKQIKTLASGDHSLSAAAQRVVKVIVLNSNKFIKIRLSEAEAMALQDDENDIINFDQRDRNAQGWLFRQFYHVIIQSSVPLINGGDSPKDLSHIASCWRIALDLVTALPEFLGYTIERGVLKLCVQLLQSLVKLSDSEGKESDSVGNLLQFIIYIMKLKSSPNKLEFFNSDVSPLVQEYMQQNKIVKSMKIVLSKILDSAVEHYTAIHRNTSITSNDDGYEADHSDESEECWQSNEKKKSKIVFYPGFHLFTFGLKQLMMVEDEDSKLLALEYLLYQLSQVELRDKEVNSNLDSGLLDMLLEEILKASDHKDSKKLEFVSKHVFKIISSVASISLASQTLSKLFSLINRKSSLQPVLFSLFSSLIKERTFDYEARGISILGSRSRERLSSNQSSDSGFSNISISSGTLSSSRQLFIKSASDDLEKDYTVITRMKMEASTNQNRDDWIDLFKVENRNEVLGVHLNFVKGLKLTLTNSKGTFAAAETNLCNLFPSGKWIHLALNIGTITEGSRTTKTLSAFIDCCRVWECGLSVDNKLTAKGKREKFLSLTIGQSGRSKVGLDLLLSDLFIIGNCCYSMTDIVKDFITGSSRLMSVQSNRSRLNLKQLRDKLPDLICYCLPLIENISEKTPASEVVAHFSPAGLWNSKTFDNNVTTMTFSQNLMNNLESVLMIPVAANEFSFTNEILTTCLDTVLNFVTADQEKFDLFQQQGGFKIFSYFLNTCDEVALLDLTKTCLENAGYRPPENGFNANSNILLFPEIFGLLLDVPNITRFHMKMILTALLDFVNEENVYCRFNLSFLNSSGLLKVLLCKLVNLSKECQLPIEELSSLLPLIPSSQEYIKILLDCCLLLVPPHLLYLPTKQKEYNSDVDYFEKIHSDEVVDITDLLSNSNSNSTATETHNQHHTNYPTDLEYLETEEAIVEEWEVVAGAAENPTIESCQSSSNSFPGTSLLSAFLHCIVGRLKLLPDAANADIFQPVLLIPLIAHPCPEIHSTALQILRLRMERKIAASYNYEELLIVVSELVSKHSPSSSLTESVLSLVHGHQVNIEIAYEFSITTFSSLNLQTVAIILPAVLLQTYSNVSLCHNLISHIHELVANIPNFLSRLMELGLSDCLFSMLIRISNSPGPSSDIEGYFESDLLVDDIHNLLRFITFKHVDQTQKDFEVVLTMLLHGESLLNSLNPTSVGNHYLRSAMCLCIEEGLLCLQSGASDYKLYKPSHYLNAEDSALHANSYSKQGNRQRRMDWTGCNLVDRFCRLVLFSVNFVKVSGSLVDEEIGLSKSLFNMIMDIQHEMPKKKANDCLVKGIKNIESVAGVLLINLLKTDISMANKTQLVRKMDSIGNTISVVKTLFPSNQEKETFRLAIISLVSKSMLLDGVDSDMVTRFYGDILCVELFPDGPAACKPLQTIVHGSHDKWLEERNKHNQKRTMNNRGKADLVNLVCEKLTNVIVSSHDALKKENFASLRKVLCDSHEAKKVWSKIIQNVTHRLGFWYSQHHKPESLLIENKSGTSGIYIRMKEGFCSGLKEKHFQPQAKSKSQRPPEQFSKLQLASGNADICLADRLGGIDSIQSVQAVTQVTATGSIDGELVLSSDSNLFFTAAVDSWQCSFKNIKTICRRRYQLQDIAMEFFLTSGETHLIVFGSMYERNSLLNILQGGGVADHMKTVNLSLITKLWRQGHLSNFQYLMELNRLSGRTMNDLMQHPVFPWVLADYSSPHLDLTKPQTYRNFHKPIAVQCKDSEEKYVTNYNILSSDGSGLGGVMGPYHYASHYSNTGIVLHFLVRVPPYTGEFIKFQDGNFDLPDRSFHNMDTSWKMASQISTSDVKELIPQLFYLPEMFVNTELFNLGLRQNGDSVDHVRLPEWAAGDPRTFVMVHRQALESPHVRQELAHWIDLVFGYKQTGQEAIDAINVFHPATYHTNQTQLLDEVEARARQTMIETYGQTPVQLLDTAHPLPLADLVSDPRTNVVPVLSSVTGMTFGSYVGAPGQPIPTVVWQQSQATTVTSLVRLESNEIIGMPAKCILIGQYNTERSLGRIPSALQLTRSHLITWGHSDCCLHCHSPGEPDTQMGDTILMWDDITAGASHVRLSSVWIGHQSGRISIYQVNDVNKKQIPELSGPDYLHGHCSPVSFIQLCPEFSVSLSASNDGTIVTWDLSSHQFLHHIKLQHSNIHGSSTLASMSGKSGDIAVVRTNILYLLSINLNLICQAEVEGRVTAVTFSNEEEGVSINCVALGMNNGTVRLYSSLDLKFLRDVSGAPMSPVTSLVYSEDSQNLAVATEDHTVTIFEKSGKKGRNKTPRYLTLL